MASFSSFVGGLVDIRRPAVSFGLEIAERGNQRINGSIRISSLAIEVRVSLLFVAMLPILTSYLIFSAVPLLYGLYEYHRAVNTLHQLALRSFQNKSYCPRETVDFFLKQPGMLEVLLSKEGNGVPLVDEGGVLLAKRLVEDSTVGMESNSSRLKAFKILLRQPFLAQAAKSLFLTAMENKNPFFALAFLENKEINSADYTAREHAEIWTSVNNEKLAFLLKERGFDINAKGNEGTTALVRALALRDVNKVSLLLKFKATPPGPDLMLNLSRCESDSLAGLTSVSSLLQRQPQIARVIGQAVAAEGCLSQEILPEEDTSFSSFLTPPVDVGGCNESFRVKGETIVFRTLMLALPAIFLSGVFLYAGGATSVTWAVTYFISMMTPFIYYEKQWSLATKQLNKIALRAMQKPFYPSLVSRYVLDHPELARYYHGVDGRNAWLYNREGEDLWEVLLQGASSKGVSEERLYAFKILAEGRFVEASQEVKYTQLVKVISTGAPELLQELLDSGKIREGDFSPDQIFAIWGQIRHQKIAEVFAAHDFGKTSFNAQGKRVVQIFLADSNKLSLKARMACLELLIKRGFSMPEAWSREENHHIQADPTIRQLILQPRL